MTQPYHPDQTWHGDAPPYVIAQRVAQAWQREPSPYRLVRDRRRTCSFVVLLDGAEVGDITVMHGEPLFRGPKTPEFCAAADRVERALEALR